MIASSISTLLNDARSEASPVRVVANSADWFSANPNERNRLPYVPVASRAAFSESPNASVAVSANARTSDDAVPNTTPIFETDSSASDAASIVPRKNDPTCCTENAAANARPMRFADFATGVSTSCRSCCSNPFVSGVIRTWASPTTAISRHSTSVSPLSGRGSRPPSKSAIACAPRCASAPVPHVSASGHGAVDSRSRNPSNAEANPGWC